MNLCKSREERGAITSTNATICMAEYDGLDMNPIFLTKLLVTLPERATGFWRSRMK